MMQPKRNHSAAGINPFRPGMGLDPPYLADRTAQLARFDQYVTGFPVFPRNVRLTGLRGVGKTVLLQRYAAAAEDRGWVVVRRECSEHLQDESTFALALVADCRRAVEHSSRTGAVRMRSSTAARRALDMLGGLTISLEGVTLAVKPPAVAARQPALLEDRLFQALELACEGAVEGRRPGVLLSYDEAHVLRDTPRLHDYPLGLFLASVARAQRQRPTILRALDHAFFDARLAKTSSLERRFLHAIASEGEDASIQSLLQLLKLSNHRIQPLVARLEHKGLLYRPERGRLAFTVPLLGDYLVRNAGDR